MKQADGSITILMTFLFLLLFALTGTTLDSARFFASKGYVMASAYGAELAVYGNYNRELYEDYDLFAYGGYDGLGIEDWRSEFEELLGENLAEKPESDSGGSLFPKHYSSVYQLGSVSATVKDVHFLTEKKYLIKQVNAWLLTEKVKDITGELLSCIHGTDQGKQQELIGNLTDSEKAKEMAESEQEAGDLEKTPGKSKGMPGDTSNSGEDKSSKDTGKSKKASKSGGKSGKGTGKTKEATKTGGKSSKASGKSKTADKSKEATKAGEKSGKGTGKSKAADQSKKDKKEKQKAVENPIEFVKTLFCDGMLSLVCDEKKISKLTLQQETGNQNEEKAVKGWDQKASGSNMLKSLLKSHPSMWNDEMLNDLLTKGKLLTYATAQLGSYLDAHDRKVPYGLEYMITGKKNQKLAFSAIVSRLLFIRSLINFAYVESDPVLQEKSMKTATALAVAFGAEAFAPAIQHSILLVLSLEEACVDVCGLLDGRRVPLCKEQSSFQMNYEEICSAGKALFQKKSKNYPKIEHEMSTTKLSQGVGYLHYLWLFLLMCPTDTLTTRLFDAVQYDLREKYNQTFTAGDCICQTKVKLSYQLPLLAGMFGVKLQRGKGEEEQIGGIKRTFELAYGYQG